MKHDTLFRSFARLTAILLPLGISACDSDVDVERPIALPLTPIAVDEDAEDEDEGDEGDEGEPDADDGDGEDEPDADDGDVPPPPDCEGEHCGDPTEPPPPGGTCEQQREQCLAEGLPEEACQELLDACTAGDPGDPPGEPTCEEQRDACLGSGTSAETCQAELEECEGSSDGSCEALRDDCLASGTPSFFCELSFESCEVDACESQRAECVAELSEDVCAEIFGDCSGGGGGY
jgi:hypothetical protein